MFAKVLSVFSGKKVSPSKLILADFHEHRETYEDIWNRIPNGQVELKYYETDKKYVSTVSYRLHSGQICTLAVHNIKFRNRDLKTQMLIKAIDEIKNHNLINSDVKEIWAVTSSSEDVFWSNVFNKAFKARSPAHPSVTGSGYYMEIDKKIDF
jgi:hypothetical protein